MDEADQPAKWVPRRKSYSPSWLRAGGDVYSEQQSEYSKYAKAQQADEVTLPAPAPDGEGDGDGEATRDDAAPVDPAIPASPRAVHESSVEARHEGLHDCD